MTIAPQKPLGTAPTHHREVLHGKRNTDKPAPRGARKYTAIERARQLCDPGTFHEMTPMRARGTSGVLGGWGLVEGRPVVVVSHDASVASGAISAVFAEGVQQAQRLAIEKGFPIVYLNDSGGARIDDGIHALHGCGGIFKLNVLASNKVPQISVILGPCAGAAAYSPALTDWTIMVKGQAQMFLTGPSVVKAATGEDATAEEIGGSGMHTKVSGVAHLEVDDEDEAFAATRRLLSYIPSKVGGEMPMRAPNQPDPIAEAELPHVVPDKSSVIFDMGRVVAGVVDEGSVFEMTPDYAPSILTLFARLEGRPVGVLANQPNARGGILDAKAAVKASRFVEFCTRFGVPVLTFVDVPGFLPGTVEESRGVITHGATLLRAYAAAESPLLTVVVRKAYGGAYIAMGAKSLGADFSWAWSGSEIAVMGPGGAVNLLHRRALAASDDPDGLRNELAAEYRENVARPYLAAEAGVIDEVILPEETRPRMVAALAMLSAS